MGRSGHRGETVSGLRVMEDRRGHLCSLGSGSASALYWYVVRGVLSSSEVVGPASKVHTRCSHRLPGQETLKCDQEPANNLLEYPYRSVCLWNMGGKMIEWIYRLCCVVVCSWECIYKSPNRTGYRAMLNKRS